LRGRLSGRIIVNEQTIIRMIPVKVQCACGQRYSFDVEPVNGRMPYAVACPVCNADDTAAANNIIAQALGSAPAPAPAPLVTGAPRPAASAPAAPANRRTADDDDERGGFASDTWKWWYYVLAGLCVGAYSIWQAYTKQSIKPLGELFLSVICIAIGIWSYKSKRKKRMQRQ
jgi:hypothetical protein